MNTSTRFVATLASVVALSGFVFACSSAPAPTLSEDNEPTTPKKTTTPAKDDDDTTTDTSPTTPSTPTNETSTCGQKATAQECGDCCLASKPTAFDAADKVFFDCLCAPAACQTACSASVCATAENQNEPTEACGTCLDAQEQSCEAKAAATCDADADCKAAEACFASKCDPIAEKEEQAGGGSGGGKAPKQLRTKGLSERAAKTSYHQR